MRRSLKWQFFVSYMIVVIPLFVMLAVTFYATANILESEIIYSSELRLKQVADELQSEVISLRRTADGISIDRDLAKRNMQRNEYYALKGIEALKRFKAGDDSIAEIGVCYQDDRLYTSSGMYINEVYARRLLGLSQEGAEQFLRMLQYGERDDAFHLYSGATDAEKRLLCVMYIPHGVRLATSCVVYEFDMSRLKWRMDNLIGEYHGLAALMLDDEAVLTSGDADSLLPDQSASNGFQTWRSGDLGMGLSVMLAIEYGAILAPVVTLRTIAMAVLTVGLFIVMILCYRMSVRNYHPIRSIAHVLGVHFDLKNERNELDAIHDAIDSTMAQKRTLASVVDENRKMMRVQSCAVLFHGLETDDGELRRMLAIAQFHVEEYPLYACVMVLPGTGRCSDRQADQIHVALTRQFPLSIDWPVDGERAIALAVGLDSEKDVRKQIEDFTARVGDILKREDCGGWRIGVGQSYPKLSMLHRSLVEAAVAIRVNKHGAGEVAMFSEMISACGIRRKYDTPWVDRLNEALFTHNIDEACQVMDEFCAFASEESDAGDRSRDCYCITHAIYTYMIEVHAKQELIAALMKVETDDAAFYTQKVKDIIILLFSSEREKQDISGPIAEIVAYVQQHYMEQTMSVEVLAERFQLSKSHISRLFKENLQRNYIDYLTELRFAQARRLLRETNLSVRTIVERVGYMDPVSFNRKFKQLYGISPTDYRRACQEDPSSAAAGEETLSEQPRSI